MNWTPTKEEVANNGLGRSGFLDASTFLEQAEMWLQPESYAKFLRFYRLQVNPLSDKIEFPSRSRWREKQRNIFISIFLQLSSTFSMNRLRVCVLGNLLEKKVQANISKGLDKNLRNVRQGQCVVSIQNKVVKKSTRRDWIPFSLSLFP